MLKHYGRELSNMKKNVDTKQMAEKTTRLLRACKLSSWQLISLRRVASRKIDYYQMPMVQRAAVRLPMRSPKQIRQSQKP